MAIYKFIESICRSKYQLRAPNLENTDGLDIEEKQFFRSRNYMVLR